MSDLISRSELLKRLEEWNTSDETDKALYNFAFHRIIEQPTAYDIDKVVEEIEKANQGCCNYCGCDLYSDDVIEIVKQGDVSDDVCECRLINGYKFLYKTSCGNTFDMENNFKYCPYCGKKIKIVGDGING